jgi:hypothetical protein
VIHARPAGSLLEGKRQEIHLLPFIDEPLRVAKRGSIIDVLEAPREGPLEESCAESTTCATSPVRRRCDRSSQA